MNAPDSAGPQAATEDRGDHAACLIEPGSKACGACGYDLSLVPRAHKMLVRCPECGAINRELLWSEMAQHDPIARRIWHSHKLTLAIGGAVIVVWPWLWLASKSIAAPRMRTVFPLISLAAGLVWSFMLLVQLVRLDLRREGEAVGTPNTLSITSGVVFWIFEMMAIIVIALLYVSAFAR